VALRRAAADTMGELARASAGRSEEEEEEEEQEEKNVQGGRGAFHIR
jgi:ribosomal protein L12E/L44/L45/RPP1/RPP2